jgi:hypothetical protein
MAFRKPGHDAGLLIFPAGAARTPGRMCAGDVVSIESASESDGGARSLVK